MFESLNSFVIKQKKTRTIKSMLPAYRLLLSKGKIMKYRPVLIFFRSYCVFLIFTFTQLSCEEDFDPKGGFRDEYVVNCIFSGTYTYYQENNLGRPVINVKAYITKTFEPINILAPDTATAALVRGAKISLSQNYLNYDLRDYYLRFSPQDGKYYEVPAGFYSPVSSERIKFQTDLPVKMTVTMSDGKVLKSAASIPDRTDFTLNTDFPHGITPDINQFIWGNGVTIKWDNNTNHLVIAALVIEYRKISTNQNFTVTVPMKYVKQNGKFVPVYPSMGKYSSAHFEFAAFDSALKSIAAADPDKQNYAVGRCSVSMIEFDSELSTYFSSVHGSLDSYSVRLDENIYSNINGGLGIMGAFMKTTMPINFDPEYIKTFGYKFVEY